MRTNTKKGEERTRKYDEAFKKMVIGEYRSGRWSMEQLRRRYGLAGKSCISEWISQLDRAGTIPEREVWREAPPMTKHGKKESLDDLRRQLKELQRQLDAEQLRSEAYSRLIDLAEREHKIDIRKKDSTK